MCVIEVSKIKNNCIEKNIRREIYSIIGCSYKVIWVGTSQISVPC